MSEYIINNRISADNCQLIFRKTLIYDDEIVYDVYAIIGDTNGKEIEVGTIDNIKQIDKFVEEFEEKSGTKVLDKTIKEGYDDFKEDWR